jgi:hypothetical protein
VKSETEKSFFVAVAGYLIGEVWERVCLRRFGGVVEYEDFAVLFDDNDAVGVVGSVGEQDGSVAEGVWFVANCFTLIPTFSHWEKGFIAAPWAPY